MVVFGKFLIDQNPKITRFQSVARFGFEFSPKIANFGVFNKFLVIFILKHLAMLQKWPKSQNYQILKRCQIWMWIFPKNCWFWRFWPIFGDFEFEPSGNAAEMAKIPKLPDFTVLPDLDVDFPENCRFWHFWPIFGKKCTWIIWHLCSNRASNTWKRRYLCTWIIPFHEFFKTDNLPLLKLADAAHYSVD